MNLNAPLVLSVSLLIAGCAARTQKANQTAPTTVASALALNTTKLDLVDHARNRVIPVVLYSADSQIVDNKVNKPASKLALLNHGYGGQNTAYSFIAQNLVAHGYVVASIQHELPTDAPMATTGNLFEIRKPVWERGVQNMLFVLQEMQRRQPKLHYDQLLIVGHSNGGDMAMLFVQEHPELVQKLISLDNRRMPLPRTRKPQILTLRSSDQVADPGVLPSPAEQQTFGIQVVNLRYTQHNDMWDGATAAQKQEMNKIISSFLEN
ncbi:serine aminopeptidase domain-containing protein [Hymenobacter jejuensis]|uniref:Alpha/beta hydrolase n=1 Tax=Hymenobacter jejuensis TaxID=2502781 RepID=A0A5B7ZVK8_9BACT|nr:alpha/beta hydrolase [Hymenobacter jejuensis]QDA58829.1 alpha/beta hydrolase [Hymenobacter jejuensis]